MILQASYIDEWLDKAFRLAYFLHGDRRIAKEIVVSAMNKLETASNAQFKRYYYQPTGRAETGRAARSRVSFNDLQLLQRLVFVESENFERKLETAEIVGEQRLLIFFIKHLVRISLKRNSFYVTLGVARILHNYGTADAMEIYNIVVQDPERVHDDYYYRSRKGILMKELKARFGELLETVKVNRGEERFHAKKSNEKLLESAQKSLKFFTPWNSNCAIPEKFNPFDDVIKPFHFNKNDPDDEHRIEINRIHAAIHPDCFSRLTSALRLPSSDEKMEIPKFMISENLLHTNNGNDDDRSNPPHLEADELQSIKNILSANAASRRAASANLLRVVVDGNEQAKINLLETDSINFDLDDGAEMIEVRIVEKEGEMILATHLLSFDDLADGKQTQTVVLEGGQKISFQLQPETDEYGDIISLNCGVAYAETEFYKRLALSSKRTKYTFFVWLENAKSLLKPIAALGFLILFAAFAWIILQKSDRPNFEIVNEYNSGLSNSTGQIILPQIETNIENKREETPQIATERKENKLHTDKKREMIELKITPKKTTVPTLPRQLQAKTENRPLIAPNIEPNAPKIERFAIISRKPEFPEERNTRALTPAQRKISFKQVRKIYLDISGSDDNSSGFSEKLIEEISKTGNFSLETVRDNADARLKINVKNRAGKLFVNVSLHDADGSVIYPTQKNLSGWRYTGNSSDLPRRIAQDLSSAQR